MVLFEIKELKRTKSGSFLFENIESITNVRLF